MSNPLFQMLGNQMPMNNIVKQFQQFRQMFQGDPRQQVQQLLNSGKVTQQQYNNAVQIANQFIGLMGGK